MNDLFKMIDEMIDRLGASSPLLISFYKLLAAVLVAMGAWVILHFLISSIEKKMEKTRFSEVSGGLALPTRKIGMFGIVLITGTYVIRVFHVSILEHVFYAVLLLLMTRPVLAYVKIVLEFLENNVAARTETHLDDIVFELLNRFIGVIIGLTSVVLALDILGINVMPFIAGAGIVGVAIGFAAKDTLSNLIAGILLIIDRPFEVGDRIEVWSTPAGSSSWGDVVDIGLRATKIRTTDNIIVIIPNNEIMMRDIVNYTINSASIRVRVNIGVAYDTNIAKAKEVIASVARDVTWVMTDPPPKVVVRNFGESSVDLQLRVWISDARKRMDTISEITDRVKEAFDNAGIEIPYPKRDITITHKNEGV
ncbi:MAG: mechanosensitive ion channel family protein [Proteobacteria bacterium]|nr:mechanosensitive ion channel family protein [Pseudomonadota bacterium]